MRIPVRQIPEDGWTRNLELPLASLARVVDTHGPQTGTLRARVTLKNHQRVIAVRGTWEADVRIACRLCLDAGTVRVEAALELMVAPHDVWAAGHRTGAHEEVQLSASDLDTSFYEGEELDLTQVLEDELLIATPDSLDGDADDDMCAHCGRDVEQVLSERQPEAEDEESDNPFRELAARIRAGDTEQDR
jgi:uncharacterized metal-binding protein YceD (DUF177 family)